MNDKSRIRAEKNDKTQTIKKQISHSDVIPTLRYWLDHCNGIAEVWVRIPAKLNFKLRLYCDDDLLYINLFIPRFIITVME